jgi:hypothetical protein
VTRCSMAFQSRVQRYLRHTGIIGKPFVRTIHFSQREKMLLASGQPWIPLKAQQWYTVQPPGLSPAVRWAFEGFLVSSRRLGLRRRVQYCWLG